MGDLASCGAAGERWTVRPSTVIVPGHCATRARIVTGAVLPSVAEQPPGSGPLTKIVAPALWICQSLRVSGGGPRVVGLE